MNRHCIDGVQVAGYILDFADCGVHGGMKTVVILGGESEDGDVTIMFRQFLVANQFRNRKLGSLSIKYYLGTIEADQVAIG